MRSETDVVAQGFVDEPGDRNEGGHFDDIDLEPGDPFQDGVWFAG